MKIIRKILIGASLGLALGLATGCHKQVNAPLPAGASNQFDADTFRVLSDSHALIQSLQQQVSAGTLVLTAQQKVVLNGMISTQNTADDLYKTYKSTVVAGGNPDTTALAAAVGSLIADLGTLTQLIKGAS